MISRLRFTRTGALALSLGLFTLAATQTMAQLVPIGTYRDGAFAADPSPSEIVAHDPATQRLFVNNGANNRIDVLSISNPTTPTFLFSIPLSTYGSSCNSVAVKNGIVAVAVQNATKTTNGRAVFFDTDGNLLHQLTVGALPDMITFTPDGKYVLVANEGEPSSYNQGASSIDPLGTVSIIKTAAVALLTTANINTATATTLDFSAYNGAAPAGVRIFGPNATVAQDLEPEYIAVSANSQTAWVTLQENNAIAIIDIPNATISSLVALGYKDHSQPGNGLDPSDQDGAGSAGLAAINRWPVLGMYQPDGIAAYEVGGQTYIVTANEGDARDYTGLAEEIRVSAGGYILDGTVFPNATGLKNADSMGRLTVSMSSGQKESDADNDYEQIYVFGARSFSIRSVSGALIFDSGDQFEQIIKAQYPTQFNSNSDNNSSFDTRSDNKGPEPEAVVIARLGIHIYAFIGLERMGGIMIYEISNPSAPYFVGYVNNRNFAAAANSAAAGDLAPEGVIFIPASESPNGVPLVVTANEVSGTTTIFQVMATGDGTLPVELSSFDAVYNTGMVQLTWKTAAEVHNAGFEVERAPKSDNPEYRTIASYLSAPSLTGLGTNSSGKNYSYTDDATLLTPGGEYLYRLVDVTTDGVRTAHEPKQVLIGSDAAINDVVRLRFGSIIPNPVTASMTLSFLLPEAGDVSVEFYSPDGRRVAVPVDQRSFSAGAHSVDVSAAGLAPGVYMARIMFGGASRVKQFVVIR